MGKTQTAVEWLVRHLTAIGHLEIPQGSNIVTAIISEAKEIEKEQIIIAYQSERYPCSDSDAEQYYNETYGSKD
jgi:hypothetical protein